MAKTKSSDNINLKKAAVEEQRFTHKKNYNYFVPPSISKKQFRKQDSHQVKSMDVQLIINKINNLSKVLEKNSSINKLTSKTLKNTIEEVNMLKTLFQMKQS